MQNKRREKETEIAKSAKRLNDWINDDFRELHALYDIETQNNNNKNCTFYGTVERKMTH